MAKNKANIPYPGQDVVVYNWVAGSGSYGGAFWERRRKFAEQSADSVRIDYDENIPELAALGKTVQNYGLNERKKELELLETRFPDIDFRDYKNLGKMGSSAYENFFIKQINLLINGKTEYNRALTRINKAIKFGQTNAKTTGEGFKGLGPSMSSLFTSYLTTELVKVFEDFVSRGGVISDPLSEWANFFESRIDLAIDQAMEQMLEKSTVKSERDRIYGDSKQWKDIGEAYKELHDVANQFRDMIKSKINFDTLVEVFNPENEPQILDKALQSGVRGSGFRSFIEGKGMKLKSRQASIGGSVEEFIRTLIANSMPKGGTINDRGTVVVKGETVTTDTVTVFSFDKELSINASALAQQISDVLTDVSSKADAAAKLKDFYDRNLSTLDKNFIVYTSTKNYSLGAGFSGFHNGGRMSLERLKDYIDMAGISIDKADAFIHTVYNSMPTAIYEDEALEIKDNLRNILSAAAAKLFFDDWETIGLVNEGTQQLHMFDLDGITVPASFLFIQLGIAMQRAADNGKKFRSSFVSVSIQSPKEPIYKENEWRSTIDAEGKTNEEIKQAIYEKWNEQFQEARKKYTFSVKFLMNFKAIISQLTKA